MVFHYLRKNLSMKLLLTHQLEHFDLERAKCAKEYDRRFVYAAIEEWYGSLEAFTAHVRGPLRQELLKEQADTRLPLQYAFIILLPLVSVGIDGFIAFVRGGASLDFLCAYTFGIMLGLITCWGMVTLRVSVFLCHRLAGPSESGIGGLCKTFLTFLAVVVITLAGVLIASMAYHSSVSSAVMWFVSAAAVFWLSHGGCVWACRLGKLVIRARPV
mmetsp:Transcript_3431/g.8066  ORF Transcript_3431/g.8066 Transcript_3431/m.8066 type:complete len:215 (+) Transcript_3431:1-645(+)